MLIFEALQNLLRVDSRGYSHIGNLLQSTPYQDLHEIVLQKSLNKHLAHYRSDGATAALALLSWCCQDKPGALLSPNGWAITVEKEQPFEVGTGMIDRKRIMCPEHHPLALLSVKSTDQHGEEHEA